MELSSKLLGGFSLDEMALGHRGDERGVEAAGEEDAEGHVSHEPLDDGLYKTKQHTWATPLSVTVTLPTIHRSKYHVVLRSAWWYAMHLLERLPEDEGLVRRRRDVLGEPLRVVPPPEPAGGARVQVPRREELELWAVLVERLHLRRNPDGACESTPDK